VICKEPVTVRVPDIAVFIRSNVVEQDGYIHSAPELVVEVLSPANTRSERASKLQGYESLGVPEVWVVSPHNHTATGRPTDAHALSGSIRRYRGHLAQIKKAPSAVKHPALA
jgi:Uma2 family endonuclease